MSSAQDRESPSVQRIGVAAIILAASALLSRILGYARDAVLASQVGVGSKADAYFAAFTLPDWLNYLLAGSALSIAFLPLYTAHREKSDADADRFFATILGTLTGVAIVTTAGMWIFAAPLVKLAFGGFDAETQALTVRLTRIVLPGQVFFLAGGIIKAALFARGRFAAAALAPLIYNACIILLGLSLGPIIGVEGFAWGVLAGSILGPFLAPVLDAHGRVAWGLRFAPFDPEFRKYLTLALPLMLGQSLLTVDEWFEKIFGSQLSAGAVSYLSYARKLMLAPVAIVGQAVATAALPALTALWARGQRDEVNAVLLKTLRGSLALGVLGGAALHVLAKPMVVILYQRGAFTADDAEAVAAILTVLAFAVPAWIAQQIATRGFYARGDTWRPMVLSTVVVAAAIPLYMWCGDAWGIAGLAWAGVIGMTFNATATVLLGRWAHQGPPLKPLAETFLRCAGIGGAGMAAGHAVGDALQTTAATLSSPLLGALLTLTGAGAAFSGVALMGIVVFGDQVTREATDRLLRKLRLKKR